jgi:hypothetical protein
MKTEKQSRQFLKSSAIVLPRQNRRKMTMADKVFLEQMAAKLICCQ